MRYAIFDFTTGERGGVLPRNIIRAVIKPDTQCMVAQATTREDERYLGTDWECEHTLPPTGCMHCNPSYRQAEWKLCEPCAPGLTWHVGDVCLRCNPDFGSKT